MELFEEKRCTGGDNPDCTRFVFYKSDTKVLQLLILASTIHN